MRFGFDVPIRGSLLLLFAMAIIYLFALLSLGLFISTRAQTQTQAQQMAQMLLLPSIFLSGYIFPVAGLPTVLYCDRPRAAGDAHDRRSCAASCCATAGPLELLPNILALVAISVVLVWLTVRRVRKLTIQIVDLSGGSHVAAANPRATVREGVAIDDEQRRLIVVVEDSDMVRNVFEMTLRSEGYGVIGCEDANSGFEVIRRELPDLVLTDIGLGVTSGLELITRIRSDLPAEHQPVIIACSGFGDFEQQALSRGADTFLPKPFDLPTMLAMVASALAGKPRSEPLEARASLRARALRREAIVAAKAALSRWRHRRPEYEHLASLVVTWLPSYLGFGAALLAVIEGEHLRVFASSDPRVAKGDALDDSPSFCRDVVETGSNLVLPDATLWGKTGLDSVRFFAGVPVTDGEVAIGAIALFDDEPHHFVGEEFALLEALGRRGSDALSASGEQTLPLWSPSGLLSRAGLRMLLSLEIKRSEHTMSSLFLLVFEASDMSWRRDVENELGAARTTIAELGEIDSQSHSFATRPLPSCTRSMR